jgi:hypothetical protein
MGCSRRQANEGGATSTRSGAGRGRRNGARRAHWSLNELRFSSERIKRLSADCQIHDSPPLR